MTSKSQRCPAPIQSEKLPQRDVLLLPVIGLLTVCIITGMAHLFADLSFSQGHTQRERYMVLNDFSTGPHGIPNAVFWENSPESKPVEDRFNSCGHRAGMECGPKPAGTYRIVLVGSSMAFGLWVSREETFAALLPDELSSRTGRTIDVYNEGMVRQSPRYLSLNFNQILAAHPDMILWVISPWDLEHLSETGPVRKSILASNPEPVVESRNSTTSAEPGFLGHTRHRVKMALAEKTFGETVSDLCDIPEGILLSQYNAKLGPAIDRMLGVVSQDEKIKLLFQHYIYQRQDDYIKATLMNRQENEFLLENPGPAWESRLEEFADDAGELQVKATAAGVPLVAVLMPTRAQAAMMSMGEWPAGYNPYKVGTDVSAILARHGGVYIDILPEFRTIPNPEKGYFPIDGHLNAEGHTFVSHLMAQELTNGAVPELQTGDQVYASLKRENH